MKYVLSSLCAVGALLAWPSAAAPATDETMTWLVGESVAATRPSPGLRSAELLKQLFAAAWPGIAQREVHANAKRSWQMIADGEKVCHASAVRNGARERLALFSNTFLMPPPQVVVRRDKAADLPLNAKGEIDLPALLADPRLRGMVVDGRSYGALIDGALQQADPARPPRRLSPGDFGSNVLPMLSRNRADYTIEYDMALAMQAEPEDRQDALLSLPIAGASVPVTVGVACPRTPWGRQMMSRVDAMLSQSANAALLKEVLLRELSPGTARHYGPDIEAFYRERVKPSVAR